MPPQPPHAASGTSWPSPANSSAIPVLAGCVCPTPCGPRSPASCSSQRCTPCISRRAGGLTKPRLLPECQARAPAGRRRAPRRSNSASRPSLPRKANVWDGGVCCAGKCLSTKHAMDKPVCPARNQPTTGQPVVATRGVSTTMRGAPRMTHSQGLPPRLASQSWSLSARPEHATRQMGRASNHVQPWLASQSRSTRASLNHATHMRAARTHTNDVSCASAG